MLDVERRSLQRLMQLAVFASAFCSGYYDAP